MKNVLPALLLAFGSLGTLQAQTTVTFKPGAATGQDAMIAISDVSTCNWANLNDGNSPELNTMAWTFGGPGCGTGTIRSLLRFTGLSSIPPNALITSATLRLYGLPTSGNPGNVGTDNNMLISRMTSAWNETAVTWNTAPGITTLNQITSPASTSQWNWNYIESSPDLVAMVQAMVNVPTQNHGFMLQLENENTYRSMQFASSDNPDSTLWPELTVTYEDCNAHFTMTTSSSSNGIFTLTSPFNQQGVHHDWQFSAPNGSYYIDTTASVGVIFNQPGTYRVCHTLYYPGSRCISCIDICTNGAIAGNVVNTTSEVAEQDAALTAVQIDALSAAPNPTDKDWDVHFTAAAEGQTQVIVVDLQNRVVLDKSVTILKGDNTLHIEGAQLAPGLYVLNLKVDGANKAIKLAKH